MGWIKHFIDSSIYSATDDDIFKQRVSWRHSRFDGLCKVDILHNNSIVLSLSGLGEFWQSDSFEVILGANNPQPIKRRVQKQITQKDLMFTVNRENDILTIEILSTLPKRMYQETHPLALRHTGQWLTLEYSVPHHRSNFYLSDIKI
jgi:hypothetical protein